MENINNNSRSISPLYSKSKPQASTAQSGTSSEENSKANSELNQLITSTILNDSNSILAPHELILNTITDMQTELSNTEKPIKSYNLCLLKDSSKEEFLPDLCQKISISANTANLLKGQIDQFSKDLYSCSDSIATDLLFKSTQLLSQAHVLDKLINDFGIDTSGEALAKFCSKNQLSPKAEQTYTEIKDGYKIIQNFTTLTMPGNNKTNILYSPQYSMSQVDVVGNSTGSEDIDEAKSSYPTAKIVEFTPGNNNITIMLMNVCISIAQNNYEAGVVAAGLVDILNESLAAINALNSLLTTLNTFYEVVKEGYNSTNDSKEVDKTVIEFDEDYVYDTCKDSDADIDYEVTRSNGKNTLHLSPDEVPEELQMFFKKDSNGNYMITSDSIQDCVDYVSKMVAKVVPGCSGDSSISSVYGDSALTSTELQGFMTGLSTVTTELEQEMSNLTSDATTYANNAKSATDFLNQFISQSTQSKLY